MSEIIASTYEIIKKIGSGGGGNVYLAKHLRLGILVVLKADKRKLSTDISLLRREVDILKELNYPGIPRVQDFFAVGETVYTAMDYIEGESLDKPLKRGEKFSQPQVIEWAKELLRELSYLHNPIHGNPPRGFVHSDIKPANLMRTSDNKIYLIDFNIALALGETHVIGCSAGYSSPEHYGLDFSIDEDNRTSHDFENESTLTSADIYGMQSTITSADTNTMVMQDDHKQSDVTAINKIIVPDTKSDIYSTGATLYHLLSGQRPSKNAKEVLPLSEKDFSPPLVQIISKAMEPNPNKRFQTADEMLDALEQLREKDPRTRRWKRQRLTAFLVFPPCILAGIFLSFVGLKRMETTENWLKLCEYAQNSLQEGNVEQALTKIMQVFPGKNNVFIPPALPEAQKTLTDILGVYDLSDGYKNHKVVELPSESLSVKISPEGTSAAVVCRGVVEIFDTSTAETLAELPAVDSALAEVCYLDENTVIYAGIDGITSYDIKEGKVLWYGEPATFIRISESGNIVAAVYKDESYAKIYDASNGTVLYTVDFGGRSLNIAVNDVFVNPDNNLLTLSEDGRWLGASFSDGSLSLFKLDKSEETVKLLDSDSDFIHFEGGFFEQYLAFSASRQGRSVFAIVDTETMEQTGGFESEGLFSVQTDDVGIYIQTDNYLVQIDPVTGQQKPLVSTSENILEFAKSNTHTLISYNNGIIIFDKNMQLIKQAEQEGGFDFVQIAGDTALLGNMDSAEIRILKYENHPEAELFSYDSSYLHDEARISADQNTLVLFSYRQFRIYTKSDELVCEVDLLNAEQIYDQQFIREGSKSYLDVIYNDGTVCRYDASNGEFISEQQEEIPDKSFQEVFYTDDYYIESPLHGTPVVYTRKDNKLLKYLEEDAYLTYVTQTEDYIVVQYIDTDGNFYGQLFNDKFELLAELPCLCDVIENILIFDYPTGNIRQSRIYDIKELVSMASEQHT